VIIPMVMFLTVYIISHVVLNILKGNYTIYSESKLERDTRDYLKSIFHFLLLKIVLGASLLICI
jgi:hypothetical protein